VDCRCNRARSWRKAPLLLGVDEFSVIERTGRASARPVLASGERGVSVIREELSRLFTVEDRHRRLFARLLLAFGATVVVFVVGTVLIWALEDGHQGGDIHGFGDAAFFAACNC
jgi:hypothetical protein